MATAGDIINSALRLIGQLAEGETPSAGASADALEAMNTMIDGWSTERLSVFSTQDQTFTWPANTISRTIGPSGNFVGTRPVDLDDATYFRDASTGISYGIKLINQQQYDGIVLKTVTSTYPQLLFVNQAMPNSTMYVYPVPTLDIEFHFVSVTELAQPAVLATTLVIPPGYRRAFKYCLACEIAAEFGVEPSPTVQRIAMTAKRAIKRINNPGDIMSMPYALVSRNGRFNIFSGAAG